MNDLISIIIPVFNVKEYLDRCMRSVLNQTYTNLEIILVDDGSTDGSGVLCDLWSLKDSRVKVIHKNNEGVAAARNDGLAIAQGDYIGFADPDDWMESTMFEVLLSVIKRFNADIAICGFEEVKQTGTRIKQVDYTKCYTRDEALYELVRDADVQNYVWNKLFRRKCVPVNPFPGIRSISDLAGIYKFFQKAETVVQINRSFYHYIRRTESLAGKDGTMESHTYYCLAKQIQFEGLSDENEKIRSLAAKSYVTALDGLKEKPAPFDPVLAEKCFQIIKNAIFPFYLSHLAAFRDIKGFTEKEREMTVFLQNPVFCCKDKAAGKGTAALKPPPSRKQSALQSGQADVSAMSDQLAAEKEKNSKLQRELKNVKNGWSFRIERIITYIPRKIKSVFAR